MCHSISVSNIYADPLIDTGEEQNRAGNFMGNIGETLIKKVLNQADLKERKKIKKISKIDI